ncbi:MAG: hypothetical protein H0X37_20830 [Herpetosiphonaceae bacterium]|nr:hypothetical protein [Herpetosiphonaceae bacterium]
MKQLKILGGGLLFAAVLMVTVGLTTAAPPQPNLVEQTTVTPTSGDNKLPSVAATNGQLAVAWTIGNSGQANVALRPETSGTFTPITLGTINTGCSGSGCSSTYNNASTQIGTDNIVHYVYVQAASSIHYRRQLPGQGFGSDVTIATGQNFANKVQLATGAGKVLVVWRLSDGSLSYTMSSDNGVSWGPVSGIQTPNPSYSDVKAAAATDGTFYVTFAGGGTVYLAQSSGGNFTTNSVAGGDYYFSSVAVGPTGQVYLAWRSINNGVYYAFRQSNGSYAVSNVFRQSNVNYTTAIAVDSQSNVHLAWTSTNSGQSETYYAFRTPTQDFTTPIIVSNEGNGLKADVAIAADVVNGVPTAHIAWESFVGGQYIRYARVTAVGDTGATPTPVPPTATPVPVTPPVGSLTLNSGTAYVGPQITARITNTGGPATSYTLTDNGQTVSSGAFTADGSGGQTVTFTLPTTPSCQAVTISGTLNGPGGASNFSSSITFDGDVKASAMAVNPNLVTNSRSIQGATPAAVTTNYGDSRFTRSTFALVYINLLPGECSGLKSYIIGSSTDPLPSPSDSRWHPYSSNGAGVVNIPPSIKDGQTYNFQVFVQDVVGNVTGIPASITYDITPPTVTAGSNPVPTTATGSGGDIAHLDLSSVNVNDTAYQQVAHAAYWGFSVLVTGQSTIDSGDPAWDQYGVITPGVIGANGLDWNLYFANTTQPPATGKAYYVHLRFVDGAGNVASTVINSGAVTPQAFSSRMIQFLPYISH